MRAAERVRPGTVGAERPRLAVVEAVALASPADPYLSLSALAEYSSCSVRWLRDRLTDPHHSLPCFRLPGGKILVRRGEFDAWIAAYHQRGRADVGAIVSDVLAGLSDH
jgi:hypothetical protein